MRRKLFLHYSNNNAELNTMKKQSLDKFLIN